MKKIELYFHIPFCAKKCYYCDFLSAPADDLTKKKYMEALLTETVGSANLYKEYLVDSIFIGGGTPSMTDVNDIERLMAAVRQYYNVSEAAEVSVEVNPGTVDYDKLKRYRKAGINRLSIGLQSANDEELKAIGRIHNWQQFSEAYDAARRAGFENINVDLMSALPGQTLQSYENSLQKVLTLHPAPEHISAYSLILEEGTRLFEMYEAGLYEPADEDTDRNLYHRTKEILEAGGYRRYEISNYAKPGKECRHNCGYWQRKNYVGFGIGAASLVENTRFRNCDDINKYLENPRVCREEICKLEVQEQMEETLFLGLRMTDGVSDAGFLAIFDCTLESIYGEVIEKNINNGLLKWSEQEGGADRRLVLTEMGMDVSNYVLAQFLLN